MKGLLTFCLRTVDQAVLTAVGFLIERLTKPFEWIKKFSERLAKPFERTEKFSERLTKPFERIKKFSERLTKPFERIEKFSERLTKPFERMQFVLKRMSQAVRTDANYFRTACERSRNGKPFGNGKPLVYVFA